MTLHPVVRLVRDRILAGSRPGARKDAFKLGLAIEGGGMRGLVTSGMGTALEHLGLLDAFDIVFGTSAGAFNGAYLVAGQAKYGSTIYYQDINNEKFIDTRRFFHPRKPVVSLDYLVHDVTKNIKVLDCAAILHSPIPLVIMASSVRRLASKQLRDFSSPAEIYQALLATARMPVLAGAPLAVGEDLLYDGGVFESIPFRSAISEGCTHVLVFLSRPSGSVPKPSGRLESLVTRLLLREYPGIHQALNRRKIDYRQDVDFLEAQSRSSAGPPYIYAVRRPAEATKILRLERSHTKLLEGAVSGFKSVYEIFNNVGLAVPGTFEERDFPFYEAHSPSAEVLR